MQEIGVVKFVQIQRSPLKQGENPNRYYDPAGLMRVDGLKLTDAGALGMNGDGMAIVDIHHKGHPETRHKDGNGISFGLTANYAIMREKFGDHITDGIAGENIIIESQRTLSPDDMGRQVALSDQSSGQTFLFTLTRVVKPCKEYSSFCMGSSLSGDALKETLQFLDNGRRGYFLRLKDPQQHPTIGEGCRVFLGDRDAAG